MPLGFSSRLRYAFRVRSHNVYAGTGSTGGCALQCAGANRCSTVTLNATGQVVSTSTNNACLLACSSVVCPTGCC